MKQTNVLLGVVYSDKHTVHTAVTFATMTPQLSPDQSSILQQHTKSVGGHCTITTLMYQASAAERQTPHTLQAACSTPKRARHKISIFTTSTT
jgi:hypothetical protein